MMEVTIPYTPRSWARSFHNTDKRWRVLVLHRRAGKTVASLNQLQKDAIKNENSKYAYIAPTYKQAKNVAWDLVKHYARPIPGVIFNEAELRVDYPNGSRIQLFGSDNPDSLRGMAFNGVIFDEYSQQPPKVFTEIIRPALADTQGYAIWIGTPQGKNDFYRLYEQACTDKRFFVLRLKASESDILSAEELREAASQMTEEEYQQEFECSFEAAIQGAYYSKQLSQAYRDGRITNVPYDEMLPVHTWWDLGVGDATAIGFFQTVNAEWRMIDYYEASGEALSHYVQVLNQKGYTYGQHHAPHDIQVRELGSGKSRLHTAQGLGVNFHIVPNLSVEDGINAARMHFSKLWIDDQKCQPFLEAISQYRKEWNERLGEWKNKPLHDWTSHAADMLRYWAVTNFMHRDVQMERRVSQNRRNLGTFK